MHALRWWEWERLTTPTMVVVFAELGVSSGHAEDELVRRRPSTRRVDLPDASHDAHLDGFHAWVRTLDSAEQ